MRASLTLTPLVPWLVLLASCSTPPKPPTVDDAQRRPANTQAAIELQQCRSNLHNTRQLATEAERAADAAAATLASLAARQQAWAASAQPQAAQAPRPNSVFSVRFAYGSTQVDIPSDITPLLVAQAKAAPLVLLRGRTDGATDNPADSHIARARADAVRSYLVNAGVDPARIRATYQPAGDPVADNTSAAGRSLNRRVEIELYRVLPVVLAEPPAAQP
jgi:outer membrane protein OmpA-like peptidoglycan-associated protein